MNPINANLLIAILDILVVSILFYYIFLLLKTTRAMQLVVGIIIIGVLLKMIEVLSRITGFIALNWIIKNSITVLGISLPIILVIIFQPELRRFLGKLGTQRSFLGSALNLIEFAYLKPESIDIICRAIDILSRKKTGALLVIEREIPLDPYLESGIRIGSFISNELLISIFTPPSLLHDGAIVIKHDTIVSARVILPLTENLYISKNFGTRHRAGIGVTEETDAISVVVSEQDSRISLAVSGRITTNLTINELREMLFVMCKSKKKVTKKT
jgi:diadenylate cyclase